MSFRRSRPKCWRPCGRPRLPTPRHPGCAVRYEPRQARNPFSTRRSGARRTWRGGHRQNNVAAAAVRTILDEAGASGTSPRRALFLSFSRAAVGQIIDRTAGSRPTGRVRGDHHVPRLRLALVRRWGAVIGLPDPKLISPSEAKLFGSTSGITYNDLLPLALTLLRFRPSDPR